MEEHRLQYFAYIRAAALPGGMFEAWDVGYYGICSCQTKDKELLHKYLACNEEAAFGFQTMRKYDCGETLLNMNAKYIKAYIFKTTGPNRPEVHLDNPIRFKDAFTSGMMGICLCNEDGWPILFDREEDALNICQFIIGMQSVWAKQYGKYPGPGSEADVEVHQVLSLSDLISKIKGA